MKPGVWAVLFLVLLLAVPVFAQVWKAQIEESLNKAKTYEFTNVSLADVLRILSQDADVNIIVDSNARIDPTAKITLAVKDMTIGSVLSWVTRLLNLQWVVQDEAIFITRDDRMLPATRRDVEKRAAERTSRARATWLPAMDEKLQRKWSVTFEDKSLGAVRDSLKTLMGINIIISSDVDQKKPVNLNVSRMSGESVISWIARNAGLDYAVIDEAVYFAPADAVRAIRFVGSDLSSAGRELDLVSFDFRDTPLDAAIRMLSEKSGVSIVLRGAPAEMPKITLAGKEMALTAALKAIVSKSGLNAAILPEGDLVVVTVMKSVPVPEAPKPPQPEEPAAPSTDSAVTPVGI